MKNILIVIVFALALGPVEGKSASRICLLSGMPPSDYTYSTIRKLRYGRHWYGGVNSMIPLLVKRAKSLGADAVIDYKGSQRFGFWPWQLVRPVVSGFAVVWDNPTHIDCESIGGTYKTFLRSSLTSDARWREQIRSELEGNSLSIDEHEELKQLRKEVNDLRIEKEILKRP